MGLVTTGLSASAAAAQDAASPTSATLQLRSLAVYEYTGSYRKPARSRLVPVAIWDGTEFQPGSLYLADPEPLSVEPGNLYELLQNGVGMGQFEVIQPQQRANGWIALGKYLPNPPSGPVRLNLPARLTARAEFESDTPHFAYRPPASTGVAGGMKASNVAHASHPRLSHSKKAPGPVANFKQNALIGLPPQMRQMVAISDSASDSDSSHSYAWQWTTPGDEAGARHKLEALALQLLTMSTATTAPPPSLGAEDFHAFQLDWGSGPVYVFSACTRAADKTTTYITLIAKPDFTGGLVPLFESVTPAGLLDHQPRMRLIDAVDATGSGHADLLFDLFTGHSRQFALFRVQGTHAQEIFHTGE